MVKPLNPPKQADRLGRLPHRVCPAFSLLGAECDTDVSPDSVSARKTAPKTEKFWPLLRTGPSFAAHSYWGSLRAVLIGLCLMQCLITERTPAPEEENWPPSIVGTGNSEHPVGSVVVLDDSAGVEAGAEEAFDVIVRDPNLEQTLRYLVFLDRLNGNRDIDRGTIPSQGTLERRVSFSVSRETLTALPCRKLELVISSDFDVIDYQPEIPGDFDTAVWWILSEPTIDTTDCEAVQ